MSKKIDLESLRHLLPDLSRFGCTSYRPGHNVHWIQALHSANKPELAAQTWSGQIVTVEDEVLTVRKPDNSLILFRNHDPARLAVILEHMGVAVTVNDQFAIPAGRHHPGWLIRLLGATRQRGAARAMQDRSAAAE